MFLPKNALFTGFLREASKATLLTNAKYRRWFLKQVVLVTEERSSTMVLTKW